MPSLVQNHSKIGAFHLVDMFEATIDQLEANLESLARSLEKLDVNTLPFLAIHPPGSRENSTEQVKAQND